MKGNMVEIVKDWVKQSPSNNGVVTCEVSPQNSVWVLIYDPYQGFKLRYRET